MSASLILPWPSIRQALIRQLRSNLVLEAGLPGDWSEGLAPQGTKRPLGTLSLQYAPSMYDWTGRVVFVGVTVLIYCEDQAEAARLYQLAFTSLQDARLIMAGQTSLQCRQVSDLSLQGPDDAGATVYQVGGIFEVRVAQSNPSQGTVAFTVDSTIS